MVMNCKRLKRLVAFIMIFAAAFCAANGAGAVDFCYQASSGYAASQYYSRVKQVRATGRNSFDILSIAVSQIGYHEGDSMADIAGGNAKGTGNYTEYCYWFGTRVMGRNEGFYSAWCAFFVSWCARQAGIPEDVLGNSAYARPDGASSNGSYGYFHLDPISPEGYAPRSGDLVFIDWEADDTWDHVGLVLYYDGQRIGTVEGNAQDAVRFRLYDVDDPEIRAYSSPAYNDAGGEDLGSEVYKCCGDALTAIRSCRDACQRLLGGD